MNTDGKEVIVEYDEMELLKDVREFLSLSRRFMKKLDLLKAKDMPPQHIMITRDAAVKVGEKAYLYVCTKSSDRFM